MLASLRRAGPPYRLTAGQLVATHLENEDRLLAGLAPREQEQLTRLLRKLLVGLGDQG